MTLIAIIKRNQNGKGDKRDYMAIKIHQRLLKKCQKLYHRIHLL